MYEKRRCLDATCPYVAVFVLRSSKQKPTNIFSFPLQNVSRCYDGQGSAVDGCQPSVTGDGVVHQPNRDVISENAYMCHIEGNYKPRNLSFNSEDSLEEKPTITLPTTAGVF